MYAVIKAGGKQQKVKPGDVIEVELMHGGDDDSVTFTPLLVVDDEGKAHVGKDLGKAAVKAKLVGEHKGQKVKIFKYRPKTGYSRRQGHRQMYTLVEIEDVSLGGRAAKKPAEAKEAPQPKEKAEPRGKAERKAAEPAAEDGGAALAPEVDAEPAEEASAPEEGRAEASEG